MLSGDKGKQASKKAQSQFMIFFRFITSLSILQSTNYTVAFVQAHVAIGDRLLAAAFRLVDAARGSSMSLYSLQLTGLTRNSPLFWAEVPPRVRAVCYCC